jgi:succinyl-diaminopimelate desuccinylase
MSTRDPLSEVLRLAQDLIAIRSDVDAPSRETAVGRFLKDWFEARGLDVEMLPVNGERANLVARLPGRGGTSLMLNGHLDTVPAGDMRDAFTPRVEDGVLWGRGACDMKGSVAAMACAMVAIARDHSAHLAGDLLFAGTVGEETGSDGIKALVDAGIRADYAIVGEPTNLRIGIAHKGACFVRVSLVGRGAHGSRPDLGVNAVSYASSIVRALEGEYRASLSDSPHPLLGTPTISIGRIVGGTEPNIVAERCVLDVDRRTVPGERDVLEGIVRLVSEVCDGVEGLSYSVEEMPYTAVVPHAPLGTPQDAVLVGHARQACRGLGLPDGPIGVTYWTDGGYLSAAGMETIILGPGDIAHAHGPNEHVRVDALASAAAIYRALAERLLLRS